MRAFGLAASEVQAPLDWARLRLKDVLVYCNRGIAPEYRDVDVEDAEHVAISQRCVVDGKVDPARGRAMEPIGDVGSARVRVNDVLVNSTGRGTLGRVGIVGELPAGITAVADGHVTVLRADPDTLDSRYLNYLLGTDRFYRFANECLAVGSTNQTELNRDRLRCLSVSLPPVGEQRRIADYLDAQCARIDDSIAEQRRLRALLDEHEFAAISATLGCAERPDSGRRWPWLDVLPDTWRLIALKRVATIQSGLTLGKKYDDAVRAHPYLRVANVRNGEIVAEDIAEVEVPDDVAARHALRPGDVLMTEGGDNDKLGRGAIWDGSVADCLHQNHIFAVRPDASALLPEYLGALLWCAHGRAYFTSTAVQATNLASTNRAKVGTFPIPLPPLGEQTAILCHVGRLRNTTRQTREDIDHQAALLSEHREALITAAVTGQFDVSSAA